MRFGYREKEANGERSNEITLVSNKQFLDKAEQIGSGIMNLNLVSEANEWRNMKLQFAGIYAKSSFEYLLFDVACCLFNITIIPIYDTLGAEAT